MPELHARTGRTKGGLPVSVNLAPPPDLEPYIGRFFVTIIDQPPDQVIEDMILNETAMARVLVRGEYHAWAGPRGWRRYDGAVLFGAQRAAMRVRARGPIAMAGFSIRPGGWYGLDPRPAPALADRLEKLEGDWAANLVAACASVDDHRGTIDRLVTAVRARVAAVNGPVDPAVAEFERVARADPGLSVAAAAERLGLTPRALERQVRQHFGHGPKLVLRRGRFLDMAAVMRGLAVPQADALAPTRFYDASHLNKEFRLFVNMTPAAFQRAATPLMTPGLEARQQRKLRDLGLPAAPWLP